jgi:hypothetical protein
LNLAFTFILTESLDTKFSHFPEKIQPQFKLLALDFWRIRDTNTNADMSVYTTTADYSILETFPRKNNGTL